MHTWQIIVWNSHESETRRVAAPTADDALTIVELSIDWHNRANRSCSRLHQYVQDIAHWRGCDCWKNKIVVDNAESSGRLRP